MFLNFVSANQILLKGSNNNLKTTVFLNEYKGPQLDVQIQTKLSVQIQAKMSPPEAAWTSG